MWLFFLIDSFIKNVEKRDILDYAKTISYSNQYCNRFWLDPDLFVKNKKDSFIMYWQINFVSKDRSAI